MFFIASEMEETNNLHKIISLPALFNNSNLLEFSIEPDKRCLVLGQSFLQFCVELEQQFVPDNNFGSKV